MGLHAQVRSSVEGDVPVSLDVVDALKDLVGFTWTQVRSLVRYNAGSCCSHMHAN